MVRLERFELSTSCFGGTRSIHLSYSRGASCFHGIAVVAAAHTFIYITRLGLRLWPAAESPGHGRFRSRLILAE